MSVKDARWEAVDRWIGETIAPSDEVLDAALRASEAAGLPSIQVSAAQGKMLQILARACNAKHVLEVGTLGGYSTIWIARALPSDGKLITLELKDEHAKVARDNLARAKLERVVDVRVGRAIEILPKIAAENGPKFDFVFIDADKPGNADYFEWAVKLSRKGALIVVDNVVRGGAVTDDKSDDANVLGVRRLHDAIRNDARVTATSIQTVGVKGYDGFLIANVL